MTDSAPPRDSMTPLERLRAFRAGEAYDRIPCSAMLSDHAALVLGVSTAEYNHSPGLMARGQIAAYRRYGHDGVAVGPSLPGFAEAAGSKLAFPEASNPFVAEPAVKLPSDFERLPQVDPHRSGRLPLFLEALALLVEEVGAEVPVAAAIGGPFTTAANLRGTEQFLRDITRDPDFARQLLEYSLDIMLGFVRAAASLPIGFNLADPVASGTVVSARVYREFALPYERRLIQEIVALTGRAPVLHICGKTNRIWQDMAETGAGSLSLDDVIDLAEAKAAVGDRITLSGNVRPTDSMYLGTPQIVEENVKECLRKAWDTPKGFILSVGCGLPVNSPPANVHALVNAARVYGRYPLDPARFAA
ncbi:Uroporphyrinogen decarboxylase [Rhodovastum atsumiense]|uniref:Uroporphyrinogen decarboxylase n=1 Tax=Rhodovastum atsumiense TaxID=504468 RepID=A0A5M6INQ3_9PROT|nr:uroporphyrinogen decarboxylase family protein [Rhodovastum atsumiense]KAA5609882.1 uroporphyrinogen decarboxylase [Rhodovastum atsumiense]CAH2602417.1 Uroporphyrinogen decarboxylase [Rhodovastum atsumiense]